MKKLIIKFLKFYHKNSNNLWNNGHFFIFPSCKYYPTCSEYTTEAINKYGLKSGIKLGFLRILKCNPLSRGGIDLP